MNQIYYQNCKLCPRLVQYRTKLKTEIPEGWNAPVAGFGSRKAQLLIVGLAPGKNGANRTSRPFTGDAAGDFLYGTLLKFGLAKGTYEKHAKDSLTLINCYITNAVKCVPPQNKPSAEEIRTCRPYLLNEIKSMNNLKAILCLGKISHDSVLKTLELRQKDFPFKHEAIYKFDSYSIHSSYHCSRYNTNTGRLTEPMFHSVFAKLKLDRNAK